MILISLSRLKPLIALSICCVFAAPLLIAQSMGFDKDAPLILYKNARIYTNDPGVPSASAMLVG